MRTIHWFPPMAQFHSGPAQVVLSVPVGHLMRPTRACSSEESVERAVEELRYNGGGILPVLSSGILRGVITEASLAKALGDGINLLAPCVDASVEAYTIAPYSSGAEALRLLSELDFPTLVVVDDAGHVVGLLSSSDLYPRRRMLPRPSPVGGMATPFGVYLTSGPLTGGVSQLAVMATGAVMISMLILSSIATAYALTPFEHSVSEGTLNALAGAFSLLLFLAMMRLAPLAGTHGAEHMVVHAIERGEELTPEVVARMPRVHPRCGTNIAVAVFIFVGICFSNWTKDDGVRATVAALATLFLWRPLGSFAQQYITTKKPTAKQLRSGIKAGTELIERYATAPQSQAGIARRVWNSGLLHVMAGSSIAYYALQGVLSLFKFNLPGF